MDLNNSSSMTPPLCAKGCGFYGSKENKNMCSKCYKDFLKSKLIMNTNAKELTKSMEVVVEKTHNQIAPSGLVDCFPTQSGSSSSEINVTVDSYAETSRVKNRCKNCNKKVGLTGFQCRCGYIFCGMHRYPKEHACTFDFKKADREILVKNNPIIKAEKLKGKI